ncbi:hypothetical protein XA68_17359 [Ophiocordyceps unilateralis]|uniref:Haloacid dehalogenase, type II n=1 Tax=Ophiocordyceps unilateralis TaxID=268505 RepID=A0A2A9PIY5_OPHUN|nr:hypothetical protein XA68_17359 [Ophiocordyceps unilateralis]
MSPGLTATSPTNTSSDPPLAHIRALTFDVFGTVVDWRTSVVEELILRAHRKLASNLSADISDRLATVTSSETSGWNAFAQAWRDSYMAFVRSFNPDRDSWTSVDEHHRRSLAALLRDWGLDGLYTSAELDSLSLVWHRLLPWPDSAPGLAAVAAGGRVVTAALSNGNRELLRDLDDFGALDFGTLLSADMFGAYKPDPAVYLGAVHELGLEPSQVAMVAAHLADLKAAHACGLRTIYIQRPQEEAWDEDSDEYRQAEEWIDLWIAKQDDGLLTLASRLQEISAGQGD